MSKGQAEIINDLMQKISNSIRVAMPGIIESYDFKTQKADIKIDMQELYRNETSLDYPVLSGVPVIFPRCGGASITMPISRGDTCLVMFLDRDSTSWLLGGKNAKPKSMRSHHLSDGVAIMGLSPFTKASKAINNTDLLITYDGSQIVLKPKGNIDIHSAKEVNIKTEGVIINCKNANIKAEESIIAQCKSATITSSENTSIDCKNANIKATEVAKIECKNANIKATDSSTVDCKNAIIKATGAIDTETPTFTQKGNMKIDGNVEVTGTSKLTGNATCNGRLEGDTVKTTSGVNLATHTHMYDKATTVTTPQGPGTVDGFVPTASKQAN